MTQPDGHRGDRHPADQRRSGRSRNRRDDVLRAAFDLFAERGYRGTSLSAVAARAGLTQQGVLHYFSNKETLLLAVLQLFDERDAGRLFSAPPGDGAALDHLAALMAYGATRPDVVRSLAILAAESLTDDHPARAFFVARYAELRRGAAAAVRAELGGALPDGLSPEEVSALLVAAMDGLQLQWLLEPDSVDAPALFAALRKLLRNPSSQ
ncbi:TetR/AcrR family transcriptional regulator [Planosporangium thailandense]|uniref:TetR/AcrR family transcriptional regulator n=1 Tax=Planosporangium thailandense TaxID=765197 RepID=A0ABX0Y480_9ACTN|nr:TetR/AcrR family transcriptional regulator [Planosporangium thailandense]NJC73187.1 TetR/AcrR family transcriptional regulator [Planosporangium thailandense]